eukprot:IDg22220t1
MARLTSRSCSSGVVVAAKCSAIRSIVAFGVIVMMSVPMSMRTVGVIVEPIILFTCAASLACFSAVAALILVSGGIASVKLLVVILGVRQSVVSVLSVLPEIVDVLSKAETGVAIAQLVFGRPEWVIDHENENGSSSLR